MLVPGKPSRIVRSMSPRRGTYRPESQPELVASVGEIARPRGQEPGRGTVPASARAVTDGAMFAIGRGASGGSRLPHGKTQGGEYESQPERTQWASASRGGLASQGLVGARGAGDQAFAVLGDGAHEQILLYARPA